MKNITNILIDLAIFIAFLVSMEPIITGEAIHEWLSIGLAVFIFVHLLFHWDWIIQVGKKYFKKLWHESRLNFFLDVILFIVFTTIMFSGLMISKEVLPVLGIKVVQGGTWKIIHSQSADIGMWLVAIHFGLHWRWIWKMFKRQIFSPFRRLFSKKTEPTPIQFFMEDQS